MPAERNYRCYNNKSQVHTILLVALLAISLLGAPVVFAGDDCEDIENLDKQLECYEEKEDKYRGKLSDAIEEQNEIASLIDKYLNDLSITSEQLIELENSINSVLSELKAININLVQTEQKLGEKITLRNDVLKAYYQQGRATLLELFLSHTEDLNGFGLASLVYAYDKSVTAEALDLIKKLHADISAYETAKAEAEQLQADLVQAQANLFTLKADLDSRKAQAEEEESEINERITSYEDKLADLSEKQQQILAAKSGSGLISGYIAPSYKLPDPPYSPAYAVMSYGAYTHRKGMSQYGAKGRADDGQKYEDIIKFYHGEGVDEKGDFPSKIRVQGYGEMDFQKYLYGLAEMPSAWPEHALRAQAVAARSYAYRTMQGSAYDRDGGICTTTSCQVFSKSKSDNPPSSWKEAVDKTKKEIIDGSTGADGYGWYSSTTGGFITGIGWDRKGSWPNDAYEKRANSPWFYKAWYTKDYFDESGTCGRSSPWLKESEMVDILNAWVVWDKGSSDERSHITPVTKDCWGGDPYSHDKMADKADKYGKEFKSIGKIEDITIDSGKTTEICFSTNRGTTCIDGQEFAVVFNARAPHYVAIKRENVNKHALFDIEYEN